MEYKLLTLVLVRKDDEILLGMKKRGFGAGLWNGFGGKVEDGETVEEAARRELREESGLTAIELSKRGILTFTFLDDTTQLRVHVFLCTSYEGEVGESEEMLPSWFSVDAIPYEAMWQDDKFWIPMMLDEKLFTGSFSFNAAHELLEGEVYEVQMLPA